MITPQPMLAGFQPYEFMYAHDTGNASVPAHLIQGFVNSVHDVAGGAALVLELMGEHEIECRNPEDGRRFSSHHMERLTRLSVFALNQLAAQAETVRNQVICHSKGKPQ